MSDASDISCCLMAEEEEEAEATSVTGRRFLPLLGYKSPLFLYHFVSVPPKFRVIFIICMKPHNGRSQLGNILLVLACAAVWRRVSRVCRFFGPSMIP